MKNKSRNFWKWFLWAIVICFGAIAGVFLYFSQDLPDPNTLGTKVVPQSVKIYDREGKVLLYNAGVAENRQEVNFESIPNCVKLTTLAAEDDDFYKHGAIDIKSLLRSAAKSVFNVKKFGTGASTITQQLARNAFLTQEKTYSRKIKEIILSFYLERHYSKDKILEMYLNQVPYGFNAYGVEAASQLYFNKSVKDVGLAEAAYLASLLQSPTALSPYGANRDKLEERKNWILDRMVKLGFATPDEVEKAKKEKVVFVSKNIRMIAPQCVNFVQQQLAKKYGEEAIQMQGLNIITTLDLDLQSKAEEIVAKYAKLNKENYGVKNMALVAEDPKTGQILAMVGSPNFFDMENEGNFNAAFGLRQPGSSFKPFAYITLFRKGYTDKTIVFDLPTNFNDYAPENYDHKFRGPINLRDALAQSVNIPAVKVLYLAGIKETIETAKSFGITTLTQGANYYGLPLVLGGGAVNLYEMTGAYAGFSQEGVLHAQNYILKITDKNGKVLEEFQDKSQEVFDPESVRLLNSILSDNNARAPLYGTYNNQLYLGENIQAAAKTGTSQDSRDAWIFGYTPNIVTGVWVGNNDYTPIFKGGASGGLVAAPAWHEFMEYAISKRGLEYFNPPIIKQVNKPMLNGQYVNLVGDSLQIHSILFYVDKNNPLGPIPLNPALDPQFYNWESPVISWAQSHIENFNTLYNKPLPSEAYQISYQTTSLENQPPNPSLPSSENLSAKFLNIQQGDIINGDKKIQIQIIGSDNLVKVSLFVNNNYFGEFSYESSQDDSKIYSINLPYNILQPKNELKIHLQDSNLNIFEDSIIVFR